MSTGKPENPKLIFRQLFDTETSTYTYILADVDTRDAILIDPVYEKVDRDLKVISELDLKLKYAVNTHCHADHVTGTGLIKKKLPSVKSMISKASGAQADIFLNEGDKIEYGNQSLLCLATPGHTFGCMTFVDHASKILFTGDTLMIRSAGRTDFQEGSSAELYDNVHKKLFTLPDDFTVLPAHDYTGQTVSSIGEEKKFNARLTKSREEYIQYMSELKLAYPKHIDRALPANLICGLIGDAAK